MTASNIAVPRVNGHDADYHPDMEASVYLDRYGYGPRLIKDLPRSQLELVLVIPCFFEPDLIATLQSLVSCNVTAGTVEVIVIINHSESAAEEIKKFNQNCLETAQRWLSQKDTELTIHLILQTLPAKHAGVGLARKIGMDEAIRRFDSVHKDGIIACLDADCTVSANYFSDLIKHFQDNPATPGCSIYYEHDLEGSLEPEIYQAITAYELHLRYYTHGLKYGRLPCAFQTVGSSMAVRSSAYQKQGGMNKRKAGEDFYFLQKIIKLGSFSELKTITVFPSPRRSKRVPFGTGKAIIDILQQDRPDLLTYNPRTFDDLRQLANRVQQFFEATNSNVSRLWNTFPDCFQAYMSEEEFVQQVQQINEQTSTAHSFQKRFFQWCDGFFAFKYANYARDNHYLPIPISEGARWLLKQAYGKAAISENPKGLLMQFRSLDKQS